MLSRRGGLLASHAAAHRIQIQTALFRQFDCAAHAFSREGWHDDSTLLYVQNDGPNGWQMTGSARCACDHCLRVQRPWILLYSRRRRGNYLALPQRGGN